MNSMSKKYNDICRREEEREDRREDKCPTIIKCSCPNSTPIPAITLSEGITGDVELPLAALTLDTSCICDPVIKLDFSTNYVVPVGVNILGSITLRVYKQCKNQANRVQVGTSWALSGGLAGIQAFEASIASFSVCDSDDCKEGCCTYTVVATVNAIASIAIGASFNNSTLSAVATCKQSCNECKCKR